MSECGNCGAFTSEGIDICHWCEMSAREAEKAADRARKDKLWELTEAGYEFWKCASGFKVRLPDCTSFACNTLASAVRAADEHERKEKG